MALEKALESGLKDKGQIEHFLDSELSFEVSGSYGCNTSCVEIQGGDEIVICDAGSGIRDLGNDLMSRELTKPLNINILMSHLHWDHLQGFPFFVPAYIPGNTIRIWGCHDEMEKAFNMQMQPPTFPITMEDMKANISFCHLNPTDSHHIAGFEVSIIEQRHPGTSYGYSFRKEGRKIVYSTDSEHTGDADDEDYPFISFFKGADVLIFDAQYNLADHVHIKQNWGHSSNLVGIELAVRSGVKRLCLFHNEHTLDDHQLEKFLQDSRRYLEIYSEHDTLKVLIAYDGLIIEV